MLSPSLTRALSIAGSAGAAGAAGAVGVSEAMVEGLAFELLIND